jgi:hypothetical protein
MPKCNKNWIKREKLEIRIKPLSFPMNLIKISQRMRMELKKLFHKRKWVNSTTIERRNSTFRIMQAI